VSTPEAPRRRPATDAEARALASSLRLRILRMCLDTPQTNAQLAERLGRAPASVLHHVRTLVDTGFLAALPVGRGPRGSRPRPYLATRKSWTLDGRDDVGPMVTALVDALQEVTAVRDGPPETMMSRLGLRLSEAQQVDLAERLEALVEEYAARPPTTGGRPWSLFVALHPDPDRD